MKKMTSDSETNENENKIPNGFKSNEPAPRKRILGERNGISSCPNSPEKKKETRELSCGSAGSDITTDYRCRVSPIGSENGVKKLGPYDPTTNFLSPRPEFLRYNPNWRREIVLGRGKIEGLGSDEEELSGSESVSSGSSSVDGDLIKVESCGDFEGIEGVEIEEEDEEEEEEEEFGGFRGLKWALKCLAVFGLLFLCTAYVSTMNSPTPPTGVLAIRGVGDEFVRVGGGLMKRFHGSDDGGVVVGDDDVDVEEEIARQLGEVVVVDEGEEMSYGVVVYDGNDGIVEEVRNSFDETTHQVFDGGVTKEEEIVGGTDVSDETPTTHHEHNDVNVSDGMAEENVIVSEVLVGGSSNHEETSNNHGGFSESLEVEEINGEVVVTEVNDVSDEITEEVVVTTTTTTHPVSDEVLFKEEQVVGIEVTDVSDEMAEVNGITVLDWKDKLLGLTTSTTSAIATKESVCIALLSLLVAVFASMALRFQSNCKKTSSSTAEARGLKRRRAPLLPPTPPKPRETTMPEVKLLGELEFGDACSPIHNYNSFGSADLGMDSAAASYGSFITEEKITQKKQGKQVAAAVDMSLSGTPVRRSMRIRNRVVTSP